MRLRLYPLRFRLRAIDRLIFPPPGAANSLRGALGLALRRQVTESEAAIHHSHHEFGRSAYVRFFEPTFGQRPSGLAQPPRPFVLRAGAFGSRSVPPGGVWSFDFYLFDLRPPSLIAPLIEAVQRVAGEGLGVGRGRSELMDVFQLGADGEPSAAVLAARDHPPPLSIDLEPPTQAARRVRVRFVTPAELKTGGHAAAPLEFAALFARLRDRIGTLCALYGDGPLAIDFRAMGARAQHVRILEANLKQFHAARRSTRTGQTHPLGGFTGEIEYEGELAEFLPFLRAGRWTGVGRQTVWGKGAIETDVLDPAP